MSSLSKINSIFELLRKNYRTGLTNREISRSLKIPPSTCYRILASLQKYDYVSRRQGDKRYFLGFAHMRFAESVREGMNEVALSLPYLEELHRETGETTFFTLFSGRCCVAMEVCGHIDTRISVGRGEVLPLHCSASGNVILAFLPKKEQKKILEEMELKAYTPQTITDLSKLVRRLEKIYQTGIACNFQELNNGINALATPVFNRQNRVIGALVVVGISITLNREWFNEYSPLFLKAGLAVTKALGGQYPAWILEVNNSIKNQEKGRKK